MLSSSFQHEERFVHYGLFLLLPSREGFTPFLFGWSFAGWPFLRFRNPRFGRRDHQATWMWDPFGFRVDPAGGIRMSPPPAWFSRLHGMSRNMVNPPDPVDVVKDPDAELPGGSLAPL